MNFFQTTLQSLEKAAKIMKLDDETLKALSYPQKTLVVTLPIRMDDGRMEYLEAYRVQHSELRGPFKGGIRYFPNVDLDKVKA